MAANSFFHIVVIGLCAMFMCKTQATSTSGQLPCRYRGRIIAHGGTLQLDECSAVHCNNSAFTVELASCPPAFCSNPTQETCCSICPYDVPVYNVSLLGVETVQAGTVNDIRVGLQVSVNEDGSNVRGRGLWKVNMWASANANGTGDKIGFIEQVLNRRQASRNVVKPYTSGGFQFSLRGIDFALDASATSCEETSYLCASFNMGDSPNTRFGRYEIPLHVYGVEAEDDSTPNPDRLIGCQPFTSCEEDTVNINGINLS